MGKDGSRPPLSLFFPVTSFLLPLAPRPISNFRVFRGFVEISGSWATGRSPLQF